MLEFKINKKKCRRCLLCAKDCPVNIIQKGEDGFPEILEESEKNCLKCQHCLAVCPDAALSILGKDPKDSIAADEVPSARQVEALIRNRRTVRHFKKRDVEPELLDDILKVTANSPTGENRRTLVFNVIDSRVEMDIFRDKVYELLEKRVKEGSLPERYRYFSLFVKAYKSGKDIIFRGAPHLLIVSAPNDKTTPDADCFIALSYFEIYSASKGVGTVWLGFLAHIIEFMPEVKELLGIPADHAAPYPMLFGIPKVTYPRGVQRDDYRMRKIKF